MVFKRPEVIGPRSFNIYKNIISTDQRTLALTGDKLSKEIDRIFEKEEEKPTPTLEEIMGRSETTSKYQNESGFSFKGIGS